MIRYAIIITIILLPFSVFMIFVKSGDASSRPKHASFNLKRVRMAIAGWMIADILEPWLLVLLGCDRKEHMFLPLIFNGIAAVVAVVLMFTWAKKK